MLFADDPDKRALGDTAVAIAGVLQMIAVLLAGYYIQETIEKHHEELMKPPEDKEDLALLEEQERYDKEAETKAEKFQNETTLGKLSCCRKAALYCGLFCGEIGSVMLFAPVSSLTGTPSFRKFEITDSPSKILEGKLLNFAGWPGWVVIGLGLLASLLSAIFYYWCPGNKSGDGKRIKETPDDSRPLVGESSE